MRETPNKKWVVGILYLNSFVMASSFFMIVPILAVYLLRDLAFSATAAGVITAVRTFSQQGMMAWCGTLADKIGYKSAMCWGMLIRAAGFALFGITDSFGGLIIAGMLSGFGGSLFHPAIYAMYTKLTDEHNRVKVYAIREWLSNLGYILGPVAGGFLINWKFSYVSWASSLLFIIAFFLVYLFIPRLKAEQRNCSFFQQVETAVQKSSYCRFLMIQVAKALIGSQLFIAVPIKLQLLMLPQVNVGTIYSAGALFMVLFQVPLNNYANSVLRPLQIMALASLLLASGLAIIGFTGDLTGIYTGVIIFLLGEGFAMTTAANLISQFADEPNIASFFGFNSSAGAIGGLVGNIGGGYLYDLGNTQGITQLPWLVFLCIGLCCSWLYLRENDRKEAT